MKHIGLILIISACCMILITAVVQAAFYHANHYDSSLECASGSMDPAITCFDIIIMEPAKDANRITVGTIISIPPCVNADVKIAIVHRVIATRGTGLSTEYLTKGDNNSYIDQCWVGFKNIYAVITKVKKRYPPEGVAMLREIWQHEWEQEVLMIDLRDTETQMYALIQQIKETAIPKDQYALAKEYDALTPKYNEWVEEYNNHNLAIDALRLEMQALKDGMEEYSK